jgi:hypothetical protein
MRCTNLYQTGQQSVLNTIKDAVVLKNLEVLCFVEEVLVGILTTHRVGAHLSLGHLLCDLTGGCGYVSYADSLERDEQSNIPLLLPRIKL